MSEQGDLLSLNGCVIDDLSPVISQQADRLKSIDLNDNPGKMKRQTKRIHRDHPYRTIDRPIREREQSLAKKKDRYPSNMTFLKSLRYVEYSPRQNDLDELYLQLNESLRKIFQKSSLFIDDHRESPSSNVVHGEYLCRRH